VSAPGAREAAALVRGGRASAEELAADALARIDAAAPLNAVLHVFRDEALRAARAIDARRAAGEPLGPLAGVPVAVKDNICVAGGPTTCGSLLLASYVPPRDAEAVARLRAADAVVVAKTNCDEFGMGSSNETSFRGPCLNPLDPARVPGGSSGGSAAAVAAGLVPLALGSDTGGSVRQPAAFCGVVGLKPTYGRVSRRGLVAFASSLDQIGTIARDVGDAALGLAAIAGRDPGDATSSGAPVPAFLAAPRAGAAGRRVAWLDQFAAREGVDEGARLATAEAARALAHAGAIVEFADLPLADLAVPIYHIVSSAEASSNLARHDGVRYGARAEGARDVASLYEETRGRGFGAEVKRRIMLGAFALSAGRREAFYLRAQAARAALTRNIDALLARYDLLLLPTAPSAAFLLGEKIDDPPAMYLSDLFTAPASLGGHPALSLPAPRAAGELPFGVQLVARRFDEETLVAAALALEERGFCAA